MMDKVRDKDCTVLYPGVLEGEDGGDYVVYVQHMGLPRGHELLDRQATGFEPQRLCSAQGAASLH